MEEKKKLYIDFLINRCLSMKKGEPLLISYNSDQKDFVYLIKEEALKLGIKDIYEIEYDATKVHDLLEKLSISEIKEEPYFNRKLIKDVYDMGGSILFLESYQIPRLQDIDSDKKMTMNKVMIDSQEDAKKARILYKFPWCIAAVATQTWADEVLPNEDDNLNKLWNLIFKFTLVENKDPIKDWDEKIKNNTERRNLLNSLKLKKLHYKNRLGTNLEIGLPLNQIWWGSAKKNFDKTKDLIVNMPTEEVYTSPNKNQVEGVVYSTRPLIIKNAIIDKFKLTFSEGKVIGISASNDLDKLVELINEFEGMNMLGECALVDYSSSISLSNMVFKSTLIDENASCHLALGTAFPKTIPDGDKMSDKELLDSGINVSKNHVDFMIGSSDLSIIGTDIYDNEIPIFVDGNFNEEEIKKYIKK